MLLEYILSSEIDHFIYFVLRAAQGQAVSNISLTIRPMTYLFLPIFPNKKHFLGSHAVIKKNVPQI